jgi:hypothetical protein
MKFRTRMVAIGTGVIFAFGIGGTSVANAAPVAPAKKSVVVLDAPLKKSVTTDEWLRKQEPQEWLR